MNVSKTISIPMELLNAAQKEAESKSVSLNYVIAQALEAYLKDKKVIA